LQSPAVPVFGLYGWQRTSHDLLPPQLAYLVVADSELAQDLVGVLAEVGRRRADVLAVAADVVRLGHEIDAAERGMFDRPGHLQVLHLRVREGLVDRVDGPAGHAGLVQQLDPLAARALTGDLRDQLVQLLPVRGPLVLPGEAGVGHQVLGTGGAAEALPEVLTGSGDVDLPVGGREQSGRDAGRMIVARLLGHLARHQPARRLEIQHRDLRLEQRGMDPTALPGHLPIEQRDQDSLREETARRQAGDRAADPDRPLAGRTGDRHRAALALCDLVDTGPLAVGTVLSEAGNAAVDDARVHLAHGFVVDPEPKLHGRAHVLDDHVGLARELHEDVLARLTLEVERHRPL